MPKNIVPDLGWFDGDQTKFEDWWRGMQLFLKSNRIMETDDKITAILAHLRGSIATIYTQKKLNELDKELDIQDWDDFIKKNQDNVQQQDKGSRCQIENRILQTREKKHC